MNFPMSSLRFISQLIDKVTAQQVNDFISHEGISSAHQPAYRSFHSTETALLKIQNHTSTSVDPGKAVALIMLRLSTCFDHSILHDCLKGWFGVGCTVPYIDSYLTNHKHKIKLKTGFLRFSSPFWHPLRFSSRFPLFTLYTSLLSQII